jgi:hypothetical protein
MNVKDLPTHSEKKAIESIIEDCESHYLLGPNMFSSKADFYAFLEEEVRFHARLMKLDFQKAKEAYISWAMKYHSAEYDHLL